MPYEVLVGESCFSGPEAQKVLDRINSHGQANVRTIRGRRLYYVDLKAADSRLDKIKQLLQVEGSEQTSLPSSGPNSVDIYITPRNISPWSSQATNIAHVCGLKDQVRRIERGRVISVEYDTAATADGGQPDLSFRDIIHDRMTEHFALEKPSLDGMFAERERAPLVVVDIFAQGQDSLTILQEYNKKMGLGLDPSEMEYLVGVFTKLGRPPHDVELFMFAQVNSEYVDLLRLCRIGKRLSIQTPAQVLDLWS